MGKKESNTALRSQYALRLYGWAKKHVEAGTMSISLEDRSLPKERSPVCGFETSFKRRLAGYFENHLKIDRELQRRLKAARVLLKI